MSDGRAAGQLRGREATPAFGVTTCPCPPKWPPTETPEILESQKSRQFYCLFLSSSRLTDLTPSSKILSTSRSVFKLKSSSHYALQTSSNPPKNLQIYFPNPYFIVHIELSPKKEQPQPSGLARLNEKAYYTSKTPNF